ncbi:MAG: hypothetical protein LBU90_09325 [Bacteroidales bacterium]|jgi:hypothetical protein|nr:hypothetical protein [Bacteroidales bacterium]
MKFLTSLLSHYAQILYVVLLLPFVFGLLLYFFSKSARNVFVRAGVPAVDIYVTGWIGVPIHELGHALFCLVFAHKITDIQLFKPSKSEGTLGYVTHSYDSKNWYQSLGNFFIGCGPLIFGVLMLYFLTVLFFSATFSLPAVQVVSVHTISFTSFFATLWHFLRQSFGNFYAFFSRQDFSSWQFWLYVYLSLAVSSHTQLSVADIKTMLRGLLILCLVLLVGALAAEVWQFSAAAWLAGTTLMNYVYALLLFAICVSALNFVITYVCMVVVYAIRKRELLLPW